MKKNFRIIKFKKDKPILEVRNLSKNFALEEKFYFAFGASFASIIFFYSLGYFSSIFANFIKSQKTWKNINIFIILFMLILVIYIIFETFFRLFN